MTGYVSDFDTSWTADAACKGMDPELFMLDKGETHDTTAAAKAVCRGCPVVEQCLDYALRHSARECLGIWGRTTEAQRRRMRAEMRREGTLPPARMGQQLPLVHGRGSAAYNKCRALNGTACETCRQSHAAQQRETKARRAAS